ncbi:MAG: ribonuclease, partial [Actinomycetota bacterium]
MPWFRRRKKQAEDATPAVPAVEARPEPVVAPPAAPRAAETTDPTTSRPAARRRGTRGGRGRKKPGAAAAGESSASEKPARPPAPEKPARTPAAEKPERKPERKTQALSQRQERRRQEGRRRQPQRRAPLPAAKRELVVSVDVGEQRVAVLEDGKVAEVYLERPNRRSIAGNIYLGQVDNVLPGMEAAFVEIGLEKNGFLYVDEIVGPQLERGHGRKIQDLIS